MPISKLLGEWHPIKPVFNMKIAKSKNSTDKEGNNSEKSNKKTKQ